MPLIIPTPGEDQASFIKRGHEALSSEFPDTAQRNAVLFRQWRERHGDDEAEKRAHSMFQSGDFVSIRDIPVFKEHEYVEFVKDPKTGADLLDADGNQITKTHRYGFDELKEICERSNHRILDTGDFAPLTIGHTKSSPDAKAEDQPRVAGFSGPYRLGMVGNKDAKWAIFSDEHHYADMHEEVKRLPRRSPELFLSKSKRFFDPIAALGAVTPRLDLGIHYEMSASDEQVVRYSCPYVAHYEMGAACPGGGAGQNVGLPEERKEKLEQPTQSGASMNELSDESIRRILEAFRATPEMEYVRSQMEASRAPKAEEELPGEIPAEDAAPEGTVEPKEQAAAGEGDPIMDIAPAGHEQGGAGPVEEKPKAQKESPMPLEQKKDQKEEYSADALRDLKVRYQASEDKLKAVEARVQMAEHTATNTVRQAKLKELRRNFKFDLDKQVEKCAADKMNDTQFGEHLDGIVENFQRIPVDLDLFVPALDDEAETKQRNERDVVSAAVKYAADMSRQGKYVSYDEAKAHVSKSA